MRSFCFFGGIGVRSLFWLASGLRILKIEPRWKIAPILKRIKDTFGNEEGTFFDEFFSTTSHRFFYYCNTPSIQDFFFFNDKLYFTLDEERTSLTHPWGLGPEGLKSRVQCFRQLPFCCPPFLTKFQTPSSHPTHD